MSAVRLNEKYIELLESLTNIMLKHGEQFRSRAYQKAQEIIMEYPKDILNPDDLKGYKGIGDTIMSKLKEYTQTGTLQILEKEKNNPINILTDVYGIGPKKAQELVTNGITNITQLRKNPELLNDVQQTGLKYYEDILKRIPREEIEQYKTILTQIIKSPAQFEIVGSYRRGKETSGDIDIIITSPLQSIFVKIIDELIRQRIIVEVLSRGQTKCLVIAKIKQSTVYRRVDFLYTSQEEYPFSILYFTGSKIFNTVMRHQAQQMGLTMNEHGLYTLRNDGQKGTKVPHIFTNELDIFNYLNLEYKEPMERQDGRAINIIKKQKKKYKKKKKFNI